MVPYAWKGQKTDGPFETESLVITPQTAALRQQYVIIYAHRSERIQLGCYFRISEDSYCPFTDILYQLNRNRYKTSLEHAFLE